MIYIKRVIPIALIIAVLVIASGCKPAPGRHYYTFEELQTALENNNIPPDMVLPDKFDGFVYIHGGATLDDSLKYKNYSFRLLGEDGGLFSEFLEYVDIHCTSLTPNVQYIHDGDVIKENIEYKEIPIYYLSELPKNNLYYVESFGEGQYGVIRYIYAIGDYNYNIKVLFHLSINENNWPNIDEMYTEVSHNLYEIVKNIIDKGVAQQ